MQITALVLCALVAITQAAESVHHGAGWYKKQSRLLAAGSSTEASTETTVPAKSSSTSSSSKVSKTSSSSAAALPTSAPVAPIAGGSSSAGLVGWASTNGGTTGGKGGKSVTVSSLATLRTAVEGDGPKIVLVSGMISGDGDTVDVGGNTSIYCTANSGMTGGGFRIKKVSNVIIQNCLLQKSPAPTDLIGIEGAKNVWIDHNEFISDLNAGKDDYDGQLDIKAASDFITVSHNYFHDSYKTSLVGHSDSASGDSGHLTVTYHHNRFESIGSRAPSFRWGSLHFYNNLLKDVLTSGVNVRQGAKALVENNVFINVQKAIMTNLDSEIQGSVVEKGNLFENSKTEITQVGAPSIPYSYTAAPASGVQADVVANAGVGKVSAPQ